MIEHQMREGFAPPLHIHTHEDETHYVLEGRIRWKIGDLVMEAVEGESVHVPIGTPHGFRVLSPFARLLTVTNGSFEDMVMEFSVQAQAPGLPPEDALIPIDLEALNASCARHGIELLGPPIE
ncbi:cupin domain-containing protein [Rhizobium paknamense]|uniref:Cupin type-2 domain-containing protein n=1 Tax=Rhizobium paknamense TaxID=1206817 RepID=A0ABU0IE12_9HYPH|nr:cupin domain-containing protein [Rhizobium paknamense]MDQ0455932.1 hypothetical protein [Rhizobium paknamense]